VAVTVAPGRPFAGYRIEAVAGRGGMGVVYRAVQEGLERPVALKLIAPELARDPEFRARFVRESRLAASLDHPHVIPVYEAGEEDGSLFIAMRWVDGPDLRELVVEQGPLPVARAAVLVAQVAGALEAAHARGLVHRDVKPANVLLAGGEEAPHAYLSDFGLARSDASSDRLTRTGGVLGTAAYSSPQQIEGGELDGRADVYALACVLFFALTGRPPFRRDTELATAWAQVHEQPPTLRSAGVSAPAALELALSRALAKDPAERQESAAAFAADLTAAADSQPTAGTRRLGRVPRLGSAAQTVRLQQSRVRERWLLRWLVGLFVLGAAGAVLAVVLMGDGSGSGDARGGAKHGTAPATSAPAPTKPAVPDLTGARLDRAEELLDQRGIDHDTDGGGTFGIVVPENWTVCGTDPPAGEPTDGRSVTLIVDRSC
jgi:serine/threonine-protein kinase